MEIYLMRHGLTESNIRKIYAGRSEEGLVGMRDYGLGMKKGLGGRGLTCT